MRQPLTARYRERLAGVLSCYDRIIVTGTLPGACYAKGMTGFLSARQIRIFDYPRFAEPLRDRVRERAAELASAAGITIEHIAENHIRKEDVVARVLVVRGDRPGLVHIISAMEACDTYKPWHDKHTHRTFLRPDTGKCLHYYFYFIDAELGLIYLRVPTPAFAGAGSGARSVCSSIAMGIAGWPANSPPPHAAPPPSRIHSLPQCCRAPNHDRRRFTSSSTTMPPLCLGASPAAPSFWGTSNRRMTHRAATIIAISMMTASDSIATIRPKGALPRVPGSDLKSTRQPREAGNRLRLP